MRVSISKGNSKLGAIQSISLPAGLTCRNDCECSKKCYAKRIERRRPAVCAAYKKNFELLRSDPGTFWREVEAAIMMSRFFRYHVSGDIVDDEYFRKMVEIATRNKHCKILCFTKKYDIVNNFMVSYGELPDNLHIIFSVWRNLKINNPFHLPEAHVRYRDGTTTAPEDAAECGGNCTECAMIDGGCWNLKCGEAVVFNEH